MTNRRFAVGSLTAEPPAARQTSAGKFTQALFNDLNLGEPWLRGALATRSLQRGQHLYWPADTRAYVYCVYRGALKSYRPMSDCSERISGFHFAGELLGLDALFGKPVRRGAVALDTTIVLLIPVPLLVEHVSRSEAGLLKLLAVFNEEIARLEEQLSLEQRSAEEKLAGFLLWVAEQLGPGPTSEPHNALRQHSLCLPMSRKDIGNYLGLVPETVSRLFARFVERQWLSTQRRELTIRDLVQLRRVASGSEGSAGPGTQPQSSRRHRPSTAWPQETAHALA